MDSSKQKRCFRFFTLRGAHDIGCKICGFHIIKANEFKFLNIDIKPFKYTV